MSIDLDRRLFEIFRPEGVVAGGSARYSSKYWKDGYPWSPSTNWSDIEPLIRRACVERKLDFVAILQNTMAGLLCHANWEDGQDAIGGSHSAPTLPAAAALALIEMYEMKEK